jgi:hypothetical protein
MKTHRYFQAVAISFALIFANSAPAYCQSPQNNPAPPSPIQTIKDQIQQIGKGEDVTVILFSGLEYYGAISKIEPDSFEIAETELKQKVSISYADVKKVAKGYGRIDPSTGRRQKGSRAFWILMIASIGATVGLAIWGFKRLGRQRRASPFPRIP